ncbi:MAG: AmmeMemoRadiSam system protein B [bacterium]
MKVDARVAIRFHRFQVTGFLLLAGPVLLGLWTVVFAEQPPETTRAQIDSVGFATNATDFANVLAACEELEGNAVRERRQALGLTDGQPWVAAVVPHDDYLYAGRVYLHVLPGLRAKQWLLFGVCHACRRNGLRDRLIFDSAATWQVAGRQLPVDRELRAELLAGLSPAAATVENERFAAEHSLEALLPWLQNEQPEARFVPILVPGMELPRLEELAGQLAEALAGICRNRGWTPGRDLGILISADAVHYGCEGWGPGGGYAEFGCDAVGHAAARAQDITLAQATLAGRVTLSSLERFCELVWNPGHPEYPEYPYRITWCGLYSIPFGLATALRLQTALGLPPLRGHLLRYGDSVSDGILPVESTRLGVTAPANLRHWVGYAALGYVPGNSRLD